MLVNQFNVLICLIFLFIRLFIFVCFRVVLCHSLSLTTCWAGFSVNPCLSIPFSRLTVSDIWPGESGSTFYGGVVLGRMSKLGCICRKQAFHWCFRLRTVSSGWIHCWLCAADGCFCVDDCDFVGPCVFCLVVCHLDNLYGMCLVLCQSQLWAVCEILTLHPVFREIEPVLVNCVVIQCVHEKTPPQV